MNLEENIGCGFLGYFIWEWLNGEYDEGCCLGCVIYVLAGLVGVGVVYFLW